MDISSVIPNVCMLDNRGRLVDEPLVHMQSEKVLRGMIRIGYRSAECFAEIRDRNERWHAAYRAIKAQRGESADLQGPDGGGAVIAFSPAPAP